MRRLIIVLMVLLLLPGAMLLIWRLRGAQS